MLYSFIINSNKKKKKYFSNVNENLKQQITQIK